MSRKEWTDIGRRYWQEAGVADRIDLHLDGGKAVIERLLARGEAGSFDLAFIDADKTGYDSYYEGSLEAAAAGRPDPDRQHAVGRRRGRSGRHDEDTVAIRAINAKVVQDPRVEICMVPICDGADHGAEAVMTDGCA